MSSPTVPRLATFASRFGTPTTSAANAPIRLDGQAAAWYVEHGGLDVFCVEYQDGAVSAAAKHLLRAGDGRLVFGTPSLDGSFRLVAKGLADTRLLRLDAAHLAELALRSNSAASAQGTQSAQGAELDELAREADRWIADLAHAVSADIEYRPLATTLIDAGDAPVDSAVAPAPAAAADGGRTDYGRVPGGQGVLVAPDSVISARRPDVVWASIPAAGPQIALAYLGTETLPTREDGSVCAIPPHR